MASDRERLALFKETLAILKAGKIKPGPKARSLIPEGPKGDLTAALLRGRKRG